VIVFCCFAIYVAHDIGLLSARLADIARDPVPTTEVGARGREFARATRQNVRFPQTLEGILQTVVRARSHGKKQPSEMEYDGTKSGRFKFTEMVAQAIEEDDAPRSDEQRVSARGPMNLVQARGVLAAVERAINEGRPSFRRFVGPVGIEIAIAEAESKADAVCTEERRNPLYRLRIERWAMRKSDLPGLVPFRDREFSILKFDDDISVYRNAESLADFPAAPLPGPSYLLAFGYSDSREQDPLLVDSQTIRILDLSDGTRTALEIARQMHREHRTSKLQDYLEWIERLFVSGLLGLRGGPHDTEKSAPGTHVAAAGASRSKTKRSAQVPSSRRT
jgi:hypothetical protein